MLEVFLEESQVEMKRLDFQKVQKTYGGLLGLQMYMD